MGATFGSDEKNGLKAHLSPYGLSFEFILAEAEDRQKAESSSVAPKLGYIEFNNRRLIPNF